MLEYDALKKITLVRSAYLKSKVAVYIIYISLNTFVTIDDKRFSFHYTISC